MDNSIQQTMVTSFLEVDSGEPAETYFAGNEGGISIPPSMHDEDDVDEDDGDISMTPSDDYEDANYSNLDSVSSPASENTTRETLTSLYRPPHALMFLGRFEKAKDNAKAQDKWLLVNMQSITEFNSHMLNRDTWANETVFQTIATNFVFWQEHDNTEEGTKVCTYYRIQDLPAVVLIDPITGQKMRSWRGMVQPETLLEDLLPFMGGSPSNNHTGLINKHPTEVQASAVPMKNIAIGGFERDYLPLPEEPQGDRNMLCRVGIRLPDGRRIHRNFFRSDPVHLLWSFCVSELKEHGNKTFHLTYAIPGASKSLNFDDKSQFGDSDLANSLITVTWD